MNLKAPDIALCIMAVAAFIVFVIAVFGSDLMYSKSKTKWQLAGGIAGGICLTVITGIGVMN